MPACFRYPSAAFAAAAGISFCLTGCMSGGTTYGTGTSMGKQTVEDISGLVTLSKPKPHIDYAQRPTLVEPPKTAALALPPPGSSVAVADWPNDPDAAEKARLAAARKRKSGDAFDDPMAGLPASRATMPVTNHPDTRFHPEIEAKTAGDKEKLYADAKANKSGLNKRDANGNLVRQTLYEPPTTYLEPDPSAPTVFNDTKKKKKFHLLWWRNNN